MLNRAMAENPVDRSHVSIAGCVIGVAFFGLRCLGRAVAKVVWDEDE